MKSFPYQTQFIQHDVVIRHIGATFLKCLFREEQAFPDSVFSALQRLHHLRLKYYEDLNQLPHILAIFEIYNYLVKGRRRLRKGKWFWNPSNKGNRDEPDLQCRIKGKAVVNAEVTTSEEPTGKISLRLKATIAKLEQMPGVRLLAVLNNTMEKYVKKQLKGSRAGIEVVNLAVRPLPKKERAQVYRRIENCTS